MRGFLLYSYLKLKRKTHPRDQEYEAPNTGDAADGQANGKDHSLCNMTADRVHHSKIEILNKDI